MKQFCVVVLTLVTWAGLPSASLARDPGVHRPLTLDFVRADVRNVLRLFADLGDVNILYGEDVDGDITLKLRDVPWETALRMILKTKGLEMEREGNLIRVAKAETFARERDAELDARDACLKTAPLRTRFVRVNYADPNQIAELIKPTLTPRGSVVVDSRTRTLVIRDVNCD